MKTLRRRTYAKTCGLTYKKTRNGEFSLEGFYGGNRMSKNTSDKLFLLWVDKFRRRVKL